MLCENLEKMVKKSTDEDVLDFDLSRVERIEEEGELPYCRAHVEWIKRLVHLVELFHLNRLIIL